MAEEKQQSNIRQEYNNATVGLNMDQSVNQIKPGTLTYALNAAVENFDANSVNYQNEPGNELCISFPDGYSLIGSHLISEKNKNIFFLVNSSTGQSEIGYMDNNDCIYRTLVNADCLNFNVDYPIHKVVHRITNCSTEIYWTDGYNPRRYMDIDNLPYVLQIDTNLCDAVETTQLDCNQLKIQPNFSIPTLNVADVISGGDLTSGTYQFAIQYSDAQGNPYTSYYSVTNPTPIANPQLTTPDFSYQVGKSIKVDINELDLSGQFNYYNLAVIKTINAITSVELVGTFSIKETYDTITYTGQSVVNVTLSINDIFERFPYYDIAQDLTAVQDVLVWDQLTSIDRINYQSIASKISLNWETYRIPSDESYADELNATNLRGYLRDEVYAFEIAFLLKNGKQTDGFHIPGRLKNYNEALPDVPNTNSDFIGEPDYIDPVTGIGYSPYWKIYNTASVTGVATGAPIGNATPYQYGEFAYWESELEYPCNDLLWGDLAGQKIRHHKFPDVLVSPIFENPIYTLDPGFQPAMQSNAVFPIGVKIDVAEVNSLVQTSNLTQEQKTEIVGFKIFRGDRSTNKSIVAKGMLRNIGEYKRNDQTLYYPNYPYNDLNDDPFLLTENNAYSVLGQTEVWFVECRTTGKYAYTDPETGRYTIKDMYAKENYEFCSLTRPTFLSGLAYIGPANYDVVKIPGAVNTSCYQPGADTRWTGDNSPLVNLTFWPCGALCGYPVIDYQYARRLDVDAKVINLTYGGVAYGSSTQPFEYCDEGVYPTDTKKGRRSKISCTNPEPLPITENSTNKYRQIFNSPETSFGQPFLGDILKLENVMFGGGKAHFVEVKNNAKYRLLSKEAQEDALDSSFNIAPTDVTARFTAYQAYLQIYINGITRKNYAYSFNSIASYDYSAEIGNNVTSNGITGIKQRPLDLKSYLIPGVQNIGDDKNINNFQRESSVFLRTKGTEGPYVPSFPYPNTTASLLSSSGTPLITEVSRFTISTNDLCNTPEKEQDIKVVSYYASLKNIAPSQWGQIYTYTTVDTGYQAFFNASIYPREVFFGGDTFISRFAYKTKLPFFLDNRVDGIDDSDIFYDEIGNVAYPKYWHSARSVLSSYLSMTNIVTIKAHNFDCPNNPAEIPKTLGGPSGTYRTFYDGYFYLFAYGVPNFYCESSYNTDLRQAFNDREGDFWPHVSTGIPDDWVQQTYVPIAQDNTYYYNVTYSKQNKETPNSNLPNDWSNICYTNYPFRTIYSDTQSVDADNRVNNWLTYRALSYYDFPQNYGRLISLDGIQNRAILARFENKTLMYNNLLTINTSNPQAAYVGNPNMFSAPPIDFAETDLGYVGSQNKMLLKIPQGQVTVDAKRGQIFLISGTQAVDITGFGSGVNRFMTDHLAFEILRYFPNVDIDNNFNGIGLHGVYDSKFDRVLITKLDYIPLSEDVKYDPENKEFYIETIEYITVPTTTSTTTLFPPSTTTTTSSSTTTSTSTSTTTTTTTIVPYPVVTICNQVWTKYNLDVTTYRNGDVIPQATSQAQLAAYNASGTGCWSYANYNSSYNSSYGKLYNWHAVNDPRGLAPIGYHIPSSTEWITLINCLGGNTVAGGKMKEIGTLHWVSPNTGATNVSDFTARAGGYNITSGVVNNPPANVRYLAYFWSATEQNSNDAKWTFFRWDNNAVYSPANYYTNKGAGASVRLIKN